MESPQQQVKSKLSTQIQRSEKTMSQGTKQSKLSKDRDLKPQTQPETPLHILIHGISRLTNSRLSSEDLDICINMIEAGVNPQALVEIIQNVTAPKGTVPQFRIK